MPSRKIALLFSGSAFEIWLTVFSDSELKTVSSTANLDVPAHEMTFPGDPEQVPQN